jgi:hypothetical protein
MLAVCLSHIAHPHAPGWGISVIRSEEKTVIRGMFIINFVV